MPSPRSLVVAILTIALLGFASCTAKDPRARFESALATLRSDAGGSRKAKACAEIRVVITEQPIGLDQREAFAHQAAAPVTAALRDPTARLEAQRTLATLGPASYEPLFDTVLDSDHDTQEAAVTCLIRMSNTAVPVLMPALLGGDVAAQDRAARILVRIGRPIARPLRDTYADLLRSLGRTAPSAEETASARLTTQSRTGLLAFARVFSEIGDPYSLGALVDGADALRYIAPDIAREHLQRIAALTQTSGWHLNESQRLTYERLRVVLADGGATPPSLH